MRAFLWSPEKANTPSRCFSSGLSAYHQQVLIPGDGGGDPKPKENWREKKEERNVHGGREMHLMVPRSESVADEREERLWMDPVALPRRAHGHPGRVSPCRLSRHDFLKWLLFRLFLGELCSPLETWSRTGKEEPDEGDSPCFPVLFLLM